jgi:TolB-like protein
LLLVGWRSGKLMARAGELEIRAEKVREALASLLASRSFSRSRQLRRFLELTVDWTLAGRGDDIKETTIAIEAYGRPSSFDPRIDPIVRTEARRLRGKIEEYYHAEGREDPIRIQFDRGSYVPRFVPAAPPADSTAEPATLRPGRRLLVASGLVLAALAGASFWALRGVRSGFERPDPKRSPRVVVLPLDDFSPDESNEDFALAVADSIVARLGRLENLEVVSRRSVSSLLGHTRSPSQISALFSADYVLGGSVVKVGGNCRIVAELLRGSDESQVWSETFDFPWSDVFHAQDTIATSVAEQIAEVRDRKPSPRAPSLEAYESYIKGHYSATLFNNTRRQAYVEEAERRLRRAIELDPEFAEAHAELGELHFIRLYPPLAERSEILQESRRWLNAALALDPENVLALSVLGQVEGESGRRREAVELSRRAVSLAPANAQAHAYLGERYAALGFYESALVEYQRAFDLDPLYINAYAQMIQYAGRLGRWDEVQAADSRMAELFPGSPVTSTFRGEARYRMNDLDGAARFWVDVEPLPEYESPRKIARALLSARRGDEKAARAVLEEYRTGEVRYFDHLAELAALVGDASAFVSEVERNPRCRNYRWLVTNPNLARVASDPAFVETARALHAQWLMDVERFGESLPAPPADLPDPSALIPGSLPRSVAP